MSSLTLEDYIKQQTDVPKDLAASSKFLKEKTQANRNISLEETMELIAELVSKTITKKQDVIFKPDEGARPVLDPEEKIDNPIICYEVIDRHPREIKPRIRDIKDENGTFINVWGQKFTSIVQINIFAAKYTDANAVMSDFEELMTSYTSYLKKNGVAEVLFERYMTDRNYDMYRQNMSVRSLQYRIDTEKLSVVLGGEISDCNTISSNQ